MIETRNLFEVPIFITTLVGITDKFKINDLLDQEFIENKRGEEWQVIQTSPNLQEKKRFKGFCKAISDVVYTISSDIIEYDNNYSVDITAMWGNKQKKGIGFHPHVHHNNIFSGVFYPDGGEEFPGIKFYRPFDTALAPTIKNYNIHNWQTYELNACRKDCLLVFPSWLLHQVPINNSDKDRMSISFNVMLRGRYGHPNSNQSSAF